MSVGWIEFDEIIRQLINGVIPYNPITEDDFTCLLNNADVRKRVLEVGQIIARLQNKACFLADDAAEGDFSLSYKYQLLASYCKITRNKLKFAEVIARSVIREWPWELEHLDDKSKNITVDRQPLVLRLKKEEASNTRKKHQSYRLRVLALHNDNLQKNFVFAGEARTWLVEYNENGWLQKSDDGEVVELWKQGEDSQSEETPGKQKRQKRSASATRENPKKGAGAAAEVLKPFVCGFNLYSTTPFTPTGRTEGKFRDTATQNIVFAIDNVALAPRKQRKDAHKKYVMESSLSLSLYFHEELLDIKINTPKTEYMPNTLFISARIMSMEFEATSNMSSHIAFSLIWRILRSYYEQKGVYAVMAPVSVQKPKGRRVKKVAEIVQEKEFMHWEDVYHFLEHFFQRGLDVQVRELIDSEIRTVQSMILARRLNNEIMIRPNVDLDDHRSEDIRKEIVMSALGVQFKDETVNGRRLPFVESLSLLIYRDKLDGKFLIYEEDFTAKSVKLSAKTCTDQQLNFSLYEWLHAIEELLGGSQLHSQKSNTTPRLFDRHILNLRAHVSAAKMVGDIHIKSKIRSEANNVMMIRFDEFRKAGFALHYADLATKKATYGFVDAKVIAAKTMNVKGTDEDTLKKAAEFGVVDPSTLEACGLYVYLRTAYPLNFRRIMERVGQQQSPQNSQQSAGSPQYDMMSPSTPEKRSASVILVVGTSGPNCTPMYDFELKEATMDDNEVHPEQGPADRPKPGGDTDNQGITVGAVTLEARFAQMTTNDSQRNSVHTQTSAMETYSHQQGVYQDQYSAQLQQQPQFGAMAHHGFYNQQQSHPVHPIYAGQLPPQHYSHQGGAGPSGPDSIGDIGPPSVLQPEAMHVDGTQASPGTQQEAMSEPEKFFESLE